MNRHKRRASIDHKKQLKKRLSLHSGTPSQESGLDEQDSQWQWYMSNESSQRALFKNVNIKSYLFK